MESSPAAIRRRTHGDPPGPGGGVDDVLGVGEVVGHGNLDLHMLAGLQALDGLGGVHLRRRRQDRGLGAGLGERLGEVAGVVGNAEPLGHLPGGLLVAADQRDHLDPSDLLHRLKMAHAERALAGHYDLHARRPINQRSPG
jgi:hypothetical protein